jgi:hypothetical protein
MAAIVDDGHGMNRDEFVNRWLVVGTEARLVALDEGSEFDRAVKSLAFGINDLCAAGSLSDQSKSNEPGLSRSDESWSWMVGAIAESPYF